MRIRRRTTAAVLAGVAVALGVATASPAVAAEPTGTRVTGTDPGGTRVTDREYSPAGTRVTVSPLVSAGEVAAVLGTRVT